MMLQAAAEEVACAQQEVQYWKQQALEQRDELEQLHALTTTATLELLPPPPLPIANSEAVALREATIFSPNGSRETDKAWAVNMLAAQRTQQCSPTGVVAADHAASEAWSDQTSVHVGTAADLNDLVVEGDNESCSDGSEYAGSFGDLLTGCQVPNNSGRSEASTAQLGCERLGVYSGGRRLLDCWSSQRSASLVVSRSKQARRCFGGCNSSTPRDS